MGKRIVRTFLVIFSVLLLLVIAFFVAVRYPAFQTYLAHRVTDVLSHQLKTKVSIERVEISFFNKADLVNFYMEDDNHDTMIAAQDFNVRFKVFELFNKKVNISKVFLRGATLHLHRDSTGKKLNLTDIFARLSPGTTKPTTGKPNQLTWDINLAGVELENTDFSYKDEKSHMNLSVRVPKSDIALNDLDLKKNFIAIKYIRIDGVNVNVDLAKRIANPEDTSGVFHLLPNGPKITFDELALTNSSFSVTDHNNDSILPKGIDFKHLAFSAINLTAENGSIIGDTILTTVKNLAAKERSGFDLQQFTSQLRFSTNEITLDKLHIKTNNSDIKDYLSFRYNSLADFKDFLNAVRIKSHMENTKFSLKDLNYFVHTLDKVEHNQLVINGEIDGRVNNLKGRGIDIRTGSNTVFKGDFYTRGLPNIYNASLNLRVNRLATTIEDVKRLLPGVVIPDNFYSLGLIYYTGSVDGFLTDFVSNGKLVTSIGSATTDVNFKYDKNNNKASYSGNLALNEFDLGRFFKDTTNFGKVSLQTKIDGGGLTLESLHANLDGNVSNFTFKGYNYKDIKVNGSVIKKSFAGLLQIHDPYLDMDFNGKADLTQKTPVLNFEADIRKAAPKNLYLIKDNLVFSGKLQSNFTGSKVDDMVGSLQLDDASITRDDTINAKIKHLAINAKFLSGEKKSITLVSDFAEAEMEGNFTLKELPKALLVFANKTFTRGYVDTTSANLQQDFSLDLRIFEPGDLTRIIYPKLSNVHRSRITCDFNTLDNKLNLTANIPEVSIGKINIRRAEINASSANGKFDFASAVDKVYNGDSLMLDSVRLASKTVGDDIRFDLSVSDKRKFNYADVTAFLTPEREKAVLRMDTCQIKLGNNIWHFDPNNYIFIMGKKIITNNLAFRTNNQTIYVSSYLKNDTATSFKLTLDNTSISDFVSSFAAKSKEISGVVNGMLVAENVFYKPDLYADLVVEDFKLGSELIGDINIDSRLDSSGNNILVYASVKSGNLNPDYQNFIEARGVVSLAGTPSLKIDVDAQKLGLNFLNYKFFDRYVKNCKGYATAKLSIAGPLSKPLLTGKVHLVKDTVTVSFLNTTYHLNDQYATLDEHGFNLDGIVIRDIKNNLLYGNGRINHESFRNFALAIRVNTDNGQFLNTGPKESPGFYGIAYGKGYIDFNGDINSPTISGYAKTLPGTYCKLPINSSYETNRYSFYKFIGHGKDTVITNKILPQLKLNGVTFTLELDVTPDARMDIILDPVAGDVLTGYGNGHLQIAISKTGAITMYGDYEIVRGNYLFTLQNIINKRFDLSPGGTINFAGDVYKAHLNVDAVYEVRSSSADLIDDLINTNNNTQTGTSANQNQLANAALSRIPYRLLMNLAGPLERPTITFDIKAVDPDPAIKSYVEQRLAMLRNNESDMNKEVFGLLVMNRFIPLGYTTSNAIANSNNLGGTAANTVSEFISSQLSNYLSNLLEFANIRNLNVNIGYRQYDQLNNTAGTSTTNSATLDTRRELQLALSQRLLNNRLSINAGGNLDFGATTVDAQTGQPVTQSARNVIPTGNFEVEYSLTPSGTWRAKAFNRTNYDYYNSRNSNKTGIGISYRQEFDKPSDLIVKRNRLKAKRQAEKAKETGTPVDTSKPATPPTQ